jgi:nicotinamide riboside transporter PnuC
MSQTNHSAGTPADCTKPLDQIVWRAWLEKNRQQEIQRAFARMKAVKWACVGVLLATVVVSSSLLTPYVSAYEAVVRFAIGLGAIILLSESLQARQYALVVLFAAIVLLFNPILPTFALAGNGALLLTSVLPFVASLVWIKERTQRAAVPAAG